MPIADMQISNARCQTLEEVKYKESGYKPDL